MGRVDTLDRDARAERDTAPAARARFTWRVLLLAPLTPILGLVLYGSSGRDDAYITYWEADQLLRTGRLGNYNGRPLEQSSSLLHTLLLAGGAWVTHLSVPAVGPWLAIVAGALCVPAAFWLCAQLEPQGRWAAAALVATLPPLVYWTVGGLETSLTALVVLVACAATIRVVEGTGSRATAALALLTTLLVRPEMGAVFVAGLLVAAAGTRGRVPVSWIGADGSDRGVAAREMVVVAAATAGAFLLIALARQLYFGDWFPRPVAMKTGGSDASDGLRYVLKTLAQARLWIALGAGAVLVATTRRRRSTPGWFVAGGVAGAGILAVVFVGGDWMECGRLLAPWLAVATVLVGATLGSLVSTQRVIVTAVLVAANVFGLVNYAARSSTGTAAWNHIEWRGAPAGASDHSSGSWWERRNAPHARDLPFIAAADPVLAALSRAVAPKRLMYASAQAGMAVYDLQQQAIKRRQRFWFIDIDGLADDTWDACRSRVRPSPTGRAVALTRVLAGECGPLPDVISGLDPVQLRVIRPAYSLLYAQRGVLTASSWPEGGPVTGVEWLAVRRDLVARLPAALRRPR